MDALGRLARARLGPYIDGHCEDERWDMSHRSRSALPIPVGVATTHSAVADPALSLICVVNSDG
jgi:hypothetical protein